MKEIKNVYLIVRQLSNTSMGITLPKTLITENNILPGDLLFAPSLFINNTEYRYRCRICGHMVEFKDSEDPYCIICNEENMEKIE